MLMRSGPEIAGVPPLCFFVARLVLSCACRLSLVLVGSTVKKPPNDIVEWLSINHLPLFKPLVVFVADLDSGRHGL